MEIFNDILYAMCNKCNDLKPFYKSKIINQFVCTECSKTLPYLPTKVLIKECVKCNNERFVDINYIKYLQHPDVDFICCSKKDVIIKKDTYKDCTKDEKEMFSFDATLKEDDDMLQERCQIENTTHDENTGLKYDNNKIKMSLPFKHFPHSLYGIARVGTYGVNKYKEQRNDGNWRYVENGKQRYLDAMYRHLTQYHLGNEVDNESNEKHLYHAAWNILAVIELEYNNVDNK